MLLTIICVALVLVAIWAFFAILSSIKDIPFKQGITHKLNIPCLHKKIHVYRGEPTIGDYYKCAYCGANLQDEDADNASIVLYMD